MKDLPICQGCQTDEYPMVNSPKHGWICDQCISDIEHQERYENAKENCKKNLLCWQKIYSISDGDKNEL